MGLTVILLWVPAHIGIRGNKMADKVAMESTKISKIDLKINMSKTEIQRKDGKSNGRKSRKEGGSVQSKGKWEKWGVQEGTEERRC